MVRWFPSTLSKFDLFIYNGLMMKTNLGSRPRCTLYTMYFVQHLHRCWPTPLFCAAVAPAATALPRTTLRPLSRTTSFNMSSPGYHPPYDPPPPPLSSYRPPFIHFPFPLSHVYPFFFSSSSTFFALLDIYFVFCSSHTKTLGHGLFPSSTVRFPQRTHRTNSPHNFPLCGLRRQNSTQNKNTKIETKSTSTTKATSDLIFFSPPFESSSRMWLGCAL